MFELLTTDEFDRWLSDLADERARTKIASRVARLCFGNAGDVKPVGDGVSEMRVHHGPGYRVYLQADGKNDHPHPVRRRQVEPGQRHQASEGNCCRIMRGPT
jgi:putative addiction module killer protein